MSWLDPLLLNVLPVFIVMCIVAVLIPSLRRSGAWGGIGLAWLAAFVTGLVIAFTHPTYWQLDCVLPLIRSGVTNVITIDGNAPCSGSNVLSPWLVALPPLIGIAILLAWVWRHTRPLPATLRPVAALTAIAIVIVGVGQVSESAALLSVVAVGVAAYAWPRRQRPRAS